jgi:hypothetical protein
MDQNAMGMVVMVLVIVALAGLVYFVRGQHRKRAARRQQAPRELNTDGSRRDEPWR